MKNVILLTLDATRKDTFGIYNNKNGLAIFIDSLKDQGIIFVQGQSTASYIQVSFQGLLTSSFSLDYGKLKQQVPRQMLISEQLKRAGKLTAAFHSNPYMSDMFGWNWGWNVFYDSMKDEVEFRISYGVNLMNIKKNNWLNSYARGQEYKTLLLWVHSMDVHEPYIPEQKYTDMTDSSLFLSQDETFDLLKNELKKRDTSNQEKMATLRRLYNGHAREIYTYTHDYAKLRNCTFATGLSGFPLLRGIREQHFFPCRRPWLTK